MPTNALSPLSLHDALPIYGEQVHGVADQRERPVASRAIGEATGPQAQPVADQLAASRDEADDGARGAENGEVRAENAAGALVRDRKSTRLNSSHPSISYADQRALPSFPTRRSSDLRRAGSRRSRSA